MFKTNLIKELFVLVVVLLTITNQITAQDFMDLPDFLKITGNSAKTYEFVVMKDRLQGVSDPGRLNFNYYYLKDSSGIRTTHPFNISMDANELQELAWEALIMEEPDTALVIFQEVLAMTVNYTPAMTGIGQSLEMMGHRSEAAEWYIQAININPIDYIAAWSLARVLFDSGKQDSAVYMMLYTWILNRNSIEVKKDLERMLIKSGKEFIDWSFVPQYKVEETMGKVVVSYHPAWMGYAVCQAVWDKEPGFAEGRQIKGDIPMFRERECLSCLVNTMDSDKKASEKETELIAFKKALSNWMAMEFILFEILLPEKPDMAYLLDSSRMQRLIDYLKLTRI